MARADTEGGTESKIGQTVILTDFPDKELHAIGIGNPFAGIGMKHGPSGISCLDILLEIQGLKDVIRVVYGQL
jgi:hypothetical protein